MKEFPPFDPRVSDGCTGVLDLGVRHCCEQHDKDYWYGRTEEDRKIADAKLCECIQKEGGAYWLLGWIRWVGVRVLGRRAFWNKEHKWQG